jgi:hypothetical protein
MYSKQPIHSPSVSGGQLERRIYVLQKEIVLAKKNTKLRNLVPMDNLVEIVRNHVVVVELMTVEEAAPFYGLCPDCFAEEVEEGFIPSFEIDGEVYVAVIIVDPKGLTVKK